MRDLPAAVRAKAIGAGAGRWPAELPGLLGEIGRMWDLTLGAAYGDATEAYVAAATRADGTPAVVKLLVPRPGGHAAHEIAVLRSVDGQGCVRLLAADESRDALLLERLGPAMSDLDLSQPRRLTILAELASAVWRRTEALPADVDLPTGETKAAGLAEFVRRKWTELGEPCTGRAVEQAVEAAGRRRRAYHPDRAVLAHGDVHQWNALRSGAGFRLVDPDGLRVEPEYDLGVLMREDPVELIAGDPRERARRLAALTGTDPAAIWDWGLAERVSTGLTLTAIGVQPVAAQMLAAADTISAR